MENTIRANDEFNDEGVSYMGLSFYPLIGIFNWQEKVLISDLCRFMEWVKPEFRGLHSDQNFVPREEMLGFQIREMNWTGSFPDDLCCLERISVRLESLWNKPERIGFIFQNCYCNIKICFLYLQRIYELPMR